MNDLTEEHDDINWEDLYECLYAFTDKLLKKKKWFRKSTDGSSVKGKQVHDYVTDGLERYFTNPEKFDATKGSLADYIKYNIIRTLVGNDSTSSENTSSIDIFAGPLYDEEEDGSNYLDAMLPYASALFDQQIDYDAVMDHIESEIKGHDFVEEIFLGISAGMKRREIIEEFNMSPRDFDNGNRRLSTIIKNTAKKFNLKTFTS